MANVAEALQSRLTKGPWKEGNGSRPLLVDTDERSDVYVELAVVCKETFAPVAPVQRSELFWNCRDPVWHHWARFVGVDCHDAQLFLMCRIVDHNQFARDETIGWAYMPLQDAAEASVHGREVELPVELREPPPKDPESAVLSEPCKLFLRCIDSRPTEKRLFLIRHAQSKWNQAREQYSLRGLVAFDHPLSPEGVCQAQDLRLRWQHLLDSGPDGGGSGLQQWEVDAQRLFLSTRHIFSSPLTRAVQTTLIGLKGHPGLSQNPLRLLACAREIKGAMGFDAVGSARGDSIEQHVRRMLVEALGEAEGTAVMGNLDPYSCAHEWWTRYTDSKKAVEDRVTQILNVVSSVPDESCIITGHSLFFRQLFRGRAAEGFVAERPAFAERLGRIKLGNAACVMVVVRPNETSGEAEIVDAKLMFGSCLEDGFGEEDGGARSPTVGSPRAAQPQDGS